MARGSIVRTSTKHGSIRFVARWESHESNGTRRQYSRRFSTKRDAERFLAMRLAEDNTVPLHEPNVLLPQH